MIISILQRDNRFDLSTAAPWGDVVFLLDDMRCNPFNTDEYCALIREGLITNGFDPARDQILMTGSPVSIALLVLVASTFGPTLNLLLFDPRSENGRYVMRKVSPFVTRKVSRPD